MTIIFTDGNLFETTAQAIVNTVNCVGVMGKGVALEFKKRWPDNYKAYKRACDARDLRPGRLLIFDRKSLLSSPFPRFLVNFPTKDHWRSKSKISYIELGLDSLVLEIEKYGITSIAMPPLGCGNGGLDWEEVRPIIVDKLSQLSGVEIFIYGPATSKPDEAPETTQIESKLTPARAMLLRAIATLEDHRQEAIDRLSLHKLAYLLQEFGVSLNLEFDQNLYGPYSRRLRKAISVMVGWKMLAFTENPTRSRRVRVTAAGFAAADDFIRRYREDEEPLNKMLAFIAGFESNRRLELLSSTLHHERQPALFRSAFQAPFSSSRATVFSDEERAEALLRINSAQGARSMEV